MSAEFKPHEMNPEMAGIIAERMLAARTGIAFTPEQASAFREGIIAALMARVRIDGVDWVTRCCSGGLCPDCGGEPVSGAPGVEGPEGCSDPPGPCGDPPGAVGMTGITDNPYGAKIGAAHGWCGGKGDGA